MLGDLREKLEPLGKLDILDAVGAQAMQYFGQVDPASFAYVARTCVRLLALNISFIVITNFPVLSNL